jgi:hypothetical protein
VDRVPARDRHVVPAAREEARELVHHHGGRVRLGREDLGRDEDVHAPYPADGRTALAYALSMAAATAPGE